MRLSLPRLKMPRLPGFSILVWISTALKGWVMGSREKDTDFFPRAHHPAL